MSQTDNQHHASQEQTKEQTQAVSREQLFAARKDLLKCKQAMSYVTKQLQTLIADNNEVIVTDRFLITDEQIEKISQNTLESCLTKETNSAIAAAYEPAVLTAALNEIIRQQAQPVAARVIINENAELQGCIRNQVQSLMTENIENAEANQFLITENQLKEIVENALEEVKKTKPALAEQYETTVLKEVLDETTRNVTLGEVQKYIIDTRKQWLDQLERNDNLLETHEIFVDYFSNQKIKNITVQDISKIVISKKPIPGSVANIGFLNDLIMHKINSQNSSTVNALIQAWDCSQNTDFISFKKDNNIASAFKFLNGLYNICTPQTDIIQSQQQELAEKIEKTITDDIYKRIKTAQTVRTDTAEVFESLVRLCESVGCDQPFYLEWLRLLSQLLLLYHKHKVINDILPNDAFLSSVRSSRNILDNIFSELNKHEEFREVSARGAFIVRQCLEGGNNYQNLFLSIKHITLTVIELLTDSNAQQNNHSELLKNLYDSYQGLVNNIQSSYDQQAAEMIKKCDQIFTDITMDTDVALSEKAMIKQIAVDLILDFSDYGICSSMKSQLIDAATVFGRYYESRQRDNTADPGLLSLSKAFATFQLDTNNDNLLILLERIIGTVKTLPDSGQLLAIKKLANPPQDPKERELYYLSQTPGLSRLCTFLDNCKHSALFKKNLRRMQCAVKILKAKTPQIAQQYVSELVQKQSPSSFQPITIVRADPQQLSMQKDIKAALEDPTALSQTEQDTLAVMLSEIYLENQCQVIKEQWPRDDTDVVILVNDQRQAAKMLEYLGDTAFLASHSYKFLVANDLTNSQRSEQQRTINQISHGTKVFCLQVPKPELIDALEPEGVNIQAVISEDDVVEPEQLFFTGNPPRATINNIPLHNVLHLSRDQEIELDTMFKQLESVIPEDAITFSSISMFQSDDEEDAKNATKMWHVKKNPQASGIAVNIMQLMNSFGCLDNLRNTKIVDVVRVIGQYPKAARYFYQAFLLELETDVADRVGVSENKINNARQLFTICNDEGLQDSILNEFKCVALPKAVNKQIMNKLKPYLKLYRNLASRERQSKRHFDQLKNRLLSSKTLQEHPHMLEACFTDITKHGHMLPRIMNELYFKGLNSLEQTWVIELHKIVNTTVYSDKTVIRWFQKLGLMKKRPAISEDELSKLDGELKSLKEQEDRPNASNQ